LAQRETNPATDPTKMDLADAKADEDLGRPDITRLLTINDMIYTKGASVNPVVVRQQKENVADNGTGATFGPGQRIYLTLQTGVDFIDPLNSYLAFDIAFSGGADATKAMLMGTGALRLFSDSVVTARSSQELDRCERMHVLNYHLVRGESIELQQNNYNGMFAASGNFATINTCSAVASPVGATIARPAAAPSDGTSPDGSPQIGTVCIPLKFLSPIFNSTKLMPPHLSRGLRLELACATAIDAIVAGADRTGTTYTISGVRCLLDSYTVADSVLSYLNAEWASTPSGLVYEWKSWVTSPLDNQTGTTCNLDLRRSLSMALDAFACCRETNAEAKLTNDSLASEILANTSTSQWRIGSTYLPSQNCVGQARHYALMLYWMSRLRYDVPTGTNFQWFVGGATAGAGNDRYPAFGLGKFCCVLNRSSILDQAGQALNNSSTLSFNASGLTAPAVSQSITMFCRHLRRAICFVENVVLET